MNGVATYFRTRMEETAPGRVVGHIAAADYLRSATRGVRAGAILTMIDNIGGICSGLAALPDGWVVSTNITGNIVERVHTGPLVAEANVLRRGRNNVVAAVTIRDEGRADALVADGMLTSAILVPENGPPHWDRPMVFDSGYGSADVLPPITEWLGVRPCGADAVEIDLADELRNPWGILHGGVVAMLVDLATEHATGAPPTGVVLHYLAPNRIGPVRATVQTLGTRSDGTVARVEVRDEGARRTTAVAVVTAAPVVTPV